MSCNKESSPLDKRQIYMRSVTCSSHFPLRAVSRAWMARGCAWLHSEPRSPASRLRALGRGSIGQVPEEKELPRIWVPWCQQLRLYAPPRLVPRGPTNGVTSERRRVPLKNGAPENQDTVSSCYSE